MQKLKRIAVMLLAVVILSLAAGATVFAGTAPDLNRVGSITIRQLENEEIVPGGSYTLYRVGEVQVNDDKYSFALTNSFADSQLELTDVGSAKLAEDLAGYAARSGAEGITYRVNQKGVVCFERLKPGLYLLVQETAAEGYNKTDPFLATVPMESSEGYLYDVDASPKIELEKEPEKTPEEPPKRPSVLPQTGQLNWPVPVLAIGGLVIFAAGWILVLSRKRGKHEN